MSAPSPSPQPTPVPAPRPRAVPPIGNQPFSKAADRILLELAPSHPGGQAFGNATTSTVSIEQIKEGTYSDKKATFVLLAVQLANEEIERFHFNIHLTNAPSLIPNCSAPQASKSPSSLDPSTQTPATNPRSPSHKVNASHGQHLKAAWKKANKSLSDAGHSISETSSAWWRKINSGHGPPAPPESPCFVAFGPERVWGPATLVHNIETRRHWFSPKVKSAVAEVELGGLEGSRELQYDVEYCATLQIFENAEGLEVTAKKPHLGEGGCPISFRVGFVVTSAGQVDMRVEKGGDSFSEFFRWTSDPRTVTLADTTRGGTTMTANSCAWGEGCDGHPDCRELYGEHMKSTIWKEKLIFPLVNWDNPVNDQHWVKWPHE